MSDLTGIRTRSNQGLWFTRRLPLPFSHASTLRPQYVRLQGCRSDILMGSTGVPQGTVLSPFLFTIYTSDFCFRSGTCHLQKFSDDSSIVGCITDDNDEEYRGVVENFISWAGENHLLLNIKKTKELVIDPRRSTRTTTVPITIQGEDIELVDSYKFLGVHLNKNLDWRDNTEAVYKKGQSRLYLLRRLKAFNVCSFISLLLQVLFFML